MNTAPYSLWNGPAPLSLGNAPEDTPTLTPFLPTANPTGAAFLICPGGGYGHLADHEGAGYARWLNDHGIAGFVLRYRLGSHGYRHPAMWLDAARALRSIRAQADCFGLDPGRIGVMGSSAGGHLASLLLTGFDAGNPHDADPWERVSSRPDLGVLCYPVITMGEGAHEGSRSRLLGDDPTPETLRALSGEYRVTAETPPCFLFHTWEDGSVPPEHSLGFARALRAHGVRFELHLFEHGGHGMGLGSKAQPELRHPWTGTCLHWLGTQGFYTPANP